MENLIRPLAEKPQIFLYLALDRDRSNLALARMELSKAEKNFKL